MTIRVELSDQVLAFVSQLPPLPKKRLREALHKLGIGKADNRCHWVKAAEFKIAQPWIHSLPSLSDTSRTSFP